MGAFVLFVQGELGDSCFCLRDLFRVVWFVHWKKEDESVESSAFVPFLDNLEGEK